MQIRNKCLYLDSISAPSSCELLSCLCRHDVTVCHTHTHNYSDVTRAGGALHVTDIRRQHSVFELKPKCKRILDKYVNKYGSNLGHVMTISSWEEDPQYG